MTVTGKVGASSGTVGKKFLVMEIDGLTEAVSGFAPVRAAGVAAKVVA